MKIVYVTPRALREGEPGFVAGAVAHALVRIPGEGYRPLPTEGAHVPLDDYWVRRLRDEDVVEAEPPAPAAAAPTPSLAPAA